MSPSKKSVSSELLSKLTERQQSVVKSPKRRVLVIAGAGSGKTEVMARRVAWWVAVDGVPKENIVAFTFTERAAEEMKFRIRSRVEAVTPTDQDVTLGDMYVGTIHGFCLKTLREYWPDEYHNYDVVDEGARLALVQRGFYGVLGLIRLKEALQKSAYATIDYFLDAYDLLNEYDQLEVRLPSRVPPHRLQEEADWCKKAELKIKIGKSEVAKAFGVCAARYYAYLRCRRFLDFSTSQSEVLRKLRQGGGDAPGKLRKARTHLVVDEVQDVNPVQDRIVRAIIGRTGTLTAVGDHRQAIFGWRGGKVEIMGGLFEELKKDRNGDVIELGENFRSTPRVISVANRWAAGIGPVKSMTKPDMSAGSKGRTDFKPSHVAALAFRTREAEARWISDAIKKLAAKNGKGAAHDTPKGERGLSLVDIAVLVRSTTSVRTYVETLERNGIPVVVRAGPDLFSRPEVLLFVAAFARAAGLSEFVGASWNPKSLPRRIEDALNCGDPEPKAVVKAACATLRKKGLRLAKDVETRLLLAADLIRTKVVDSGAVSNAQASPLRTGELRKWLTTDKPARRVFPQRLYHFLLGETGVSGWEKLGPLGRAAMFHLGQLSTLVKGIETPGWNAPNDFKYQVSALWLWGTHNARTQEAPLLVPPNAVTISTVHSAKGLEFPAVFLADVNPQRFPSNFAKTVPDVPFEGALLKKVDPADLADNANYDGERRLMYVALTRAERYLFVSRSGTRRSRFFDAVRADIKSSGGTVVADPKAVPQGIRLLPSTFDADTRLVTSFSDLRYYLACPHDFYLRKVLGFAPTIDQAFGYGRGVHNLLRAVHTDPKKWAAIADDRDALVKELKKLVDKGIFYLRYTTKEPFERMRDHAVESVANYVKTYADELDSLTLESEREFETLIKEQQLLVSGAVDLIRLDRPPRVTLLDFKSGEPPTESETGLDEEEMRLQVSLYGLAAKREMEYLPERGLVRYLGAEEGQNNELQVDLHESALAGAHGTLVEAASQIRQRQFDLGPVKPARNPRFTSRCGECDFLHVCGMKHADDFRAAASGPRRP